ncbi:MAG: response regulator [Actinomycetota bacterium]
MLIVDDNRLDRMLATRVFERSGRFTHVFAVNDGAEALALYEDYDRQHREQPERFPPLLVLLDINMPVMDGFTFLERYRELDLQVDHPHFILMLTTSTASVDRERAEAEPLVHEYLVKPVSSEIVEELADVYLAL